MKEGDTQITQCLVVVGLGNPGVRFANTRHNMGFLVVKALAKKWGCPFHMETRFESYIATRRIGGMTIHLLMPTTYINLSGIALQKYLSFYRYGPQNVIIVADDVALGYGELRVRDRGSSGGHNGLKSVEAVLGTKEYIRVRMGVGNPKDIPESDISLADYVLGQFTASEVAYLDGFINKGVQILEQLISEPITRVMNATNKKQKGKLGEEKHES